MKILVACLLSSLVAALSTTVLFGIEGGFAAESFGLMLIVFLYALAISLVIGIPFHYAAKRVRKERGVYYAIAGSLSAIAVPLSSLFSREADISVVKLIPVLAIAGLMAGWTFHQVSHA
jgi:hypothetical protein